MYRREEERAKRNAAVARELKAAASTSWNACADASRALLTLGQDSTFRRSIGAHAGLLEALPASLAATSESARADAVLHLTVARAVLGPLLMRVEVLGWMASAYPDALVTLLGTLSGARDGEPANREPSI